MRKASAAFILTLASVLSACGSSPAPSDRVVTQSTDAMRIEVPDVDRAGAASSQTSRVTGIKLTLMTVDDKGSRVAQVLAPYDSGENPKVFDDTEHAGWRSWGFRWVSVPLSDIESVLAAQRPTRAIDTRDMGTFPRWQPLIRVGALNNIAVRSPGGVSRIMSGRPRLLARSWRTPIIENGTRDVVVKLDLALQIERQTLSERDPFAITQTTSEINRGELLGPGFMSVTMSPTHALVLVGESPETEWAIADDGRGVAFKDPSEIGPEAPLGRSLGEVMLSRSGSNPLKVLVVLVPEVVTP